MPMTFCMHRIDRRAAPKRPTKMIHNDQETLERTTPLPLEAGSGYPDAASRRHAMTKTINASQSASNAHTRLSMLVLCAATNRYLSGTNSP